MPRVLGVQDASANESGLVGEHDELCPIPRLQLHEETRDVRLYSWLCQRQLIGDLSVRGAAGNEAKDLSLSVGQLTQPARGVVVRVWQPSREAIQQPSRDRWCEECL